MKNAEDSPGRNPLERVRPKRPPGFPLAISVIGLLVMGGFLYWQAAALRDQRASLQWPVVTGKIVQSEAVRRDSGEYRAAVTYNYTVGGTQRVSRQISLYEFHGDRKIMAFVAEHPTGSSMNVYYNLRHPENAVLIPGANEVWSRLLMEMLGFGVLVSMVGVVVSLRRGSRLRALLNDPMAPTRAVTLKRSEIQRGINSLQANFFAVGFSLILALAAFLFPLLDDTPALPGKPTVQPWRWGIGIAGGLGAVFFCVRAARQSRRAQCPICGNLFNKTVFQTAKCEGCDTQIVFEQEVPASGETESPTT